MTNVDNEAFLKFANQAREVLAFCSDQNLDGGGTWQFSVWKFWIPVSRQISNPTEENF